ncbi:sensor histidine kinase [Luteolibacter sp. GHJ8]|uniref:Oxygen sensor histidine kinase NreB n=1 Tax=Luteolibacter rhizosphaerae TaxID=2989719 RepID=A0ABT3G2C0_9BACT|nr:sensor histidine kinase [Luteolibacter rhizosphaerae]MCW1913649.1 sensor histidine kinase [Luteolibacter rhizosphaerae]
MPALLLRLLLALAMLACSQGNEVLTSADSIRELAPEEAAKGLEVKLEGVITFANEPAITLFIHDGSGGVFIEQPPEGGDNWPRTGDRVEVTGVTGAGLFAPVIRGVDGKAPEIRVLGHDALPEPRPVSGRELARPEMDCEWVSVEAQVREVFMNDGDIVFECEAGPCDFHVLLEGPLPPESVPWDLAESSVRIRGVVATIFNGRRQMTRRFMRVNALPDVVPLQAPGLEAQPRLVRADELFRLKGAGGEDLVQVRGITTLAVPGRGLFLRTDGGGLWVQTAQPIAARPGAEVEATGWARAGAMKPILRARAVRVTGEGSPPEALGMESLQVLNARHESELVSIEAELLDVFRGEEGTTIELRDPGMIFRGLLAEHDGALPDLVPGSRLRVTGIAQITSAGAFSPLQEEDKLLLRMRVPADVQVLALPPWWTTRRVIMAAAAIIAGMLGIYALVRAKRLREQETQRREFEAVLAERGRFAREIHDSLAQGLTSISLQLECVRDEVGADASRARHHLETARGLVRDSLREARRTVWNLRPLALGEADLATALQQFAQDLTRDGKVASAQQIEGTPRPLPPDHESALLRIGQEAMTNAIRHAAPSKILARLRFGSDWVTLSVIDDGRGFDVAERVGKGYGLTGMHERVAALGGSLTIDSMPGEGTEVSATLPT